MTHMWSSHWLLSVFGAYFLPVSDFVDCYLSRGQSQLNIYTQWYYCIVTKFMTAPSKSDVCLLIQNYCTEWYFRYIGINLMCIRFIGTMLKVICELKLEFTQQSMFVLWYYITSHVLYTDLLLMWPIGILVKYCGVPIYR